MSKRQQVEDLIPELMFVETARKRAKMTPEEAKRRMVDAADWDRIADAGNNLGAIVDELRGAAERAFRVRGL